MDYVSRFRFPGQRGGRVAHAVSGLPAFAEAGTLEYKGTDTGTPPTMTSDVKFLAIRKGLLEFLLLKIISADKVYVADMLVRLEGTEFATQEGTLYPLLSKMRRENLVDYEWQESEAGPPRKYYRLTARGRTQLTELNDYWREINRTVQKLER
jgi:PadR family transcriptional regulator, regulatory protein PadR